MEVSVEDTPKERIMTAATTRQNRRPRPARKLSMSRVYDGNFAVRITIGSDVSHYYVEPAPCDFGRAAFRMVKFPCEVKEGEAASHDVLIGHAQTDSTCCCKGYERWGWHADAEGKLVSCRHIDSLLELIARGMLILPPAACGGARATGAAGAATA
jgi:hypothetical protein